MNSSWLPSSFACSDHAPPPPGPGQGRRSLQARHRSPDRGRPGITYRRGGPSERRTGKRRAALVPAGRHGYWSGYQRIVWRRVRPLGFLAMLPPAMKLQRRPLRPATFNHFIDQSTEIIREIFHVSHAGPDHGSLLGLRHSAPFRNRHSTGFHLTRLPRRPVAVGSVARCY